MRKNLLCMAWAAAGLLLTPLAGHADSVTTYQYDALGRVTKVTYPDGGSVTYDYDAAGNRTRVVSVAGTPAPVKVVVLPLLGGVVIPIGN